MNTIDTKNTIDIMDLETFTWVGMLVILLTIVIGTTYYFCYTKKVYRDFFIELIKNCQKKDRLTEPITD